MELALTPFQKHCLRQTTLLDQTPKAEADQYMCQFCGKQAEKELGEGPLAPMGPITLGQFNGI